MRVRGKPHQLAKLQDEEVDAILVCLANGEKACKVAKLFKVSEATISRLKNKKTWKHITNEQSL